MYLRKTTKTHKGKTYTNDLLVESQQTPKGPRQRIICSLGALAPAPREHWLALAHRLQARLQGQSSFPSTEVAIETLLKKRRRAPLRRKEHPRSPSMQSA